MHFHCLNMAHNTMPNRSPLPHLALLGALLLALLCAHSSGQPAASQSDAELVAAMQRCTDDGFIEMAGAGMFAVVERCLAQPHIRVDTTHSQNGLTALTAACVQGHVPVIKRLLAAKAKADWQHIENGLVCGTPADTQNLGALYSARAFISYICLPY